MWGHWNLPMYSIEGWVIDPDVHGLLDGPGNTVCLPTHYGEIVHTDSKTGGVTMGIDGVRGPEMFFESYPKSPFQFICVLLFTTCLGTLEPIDYPTFLDDLIPGFGGHQEIPDSVASFKMYLAPPYHIHS